MEEPNGRWYSWGPGGPGDDMPDGVRQELLRREAQRDEPLGRLLALVDVYVWENGEADPQVSFPPGTMLSLEDQDRIAEVVRIARDSLDGWQRRS